MDDADEDADADAGSDDEADEVRPSDCVLTARTEDDFSCVEMQVYSEDDGNLFVHHDITLPAFRCVWHG